MKKIYIIFLIHLFGFSFAQKILNTPTSANTSVSDKRTVSMQPGFNVKASSGSTFIAFIDANGNGISDYQEQFMPSLGENYIKTTECLKADCTEKKETVVYYDGLGREKQVLQVGASPLGKTIVTPIEYDEFGRQAREYLPFPISNSSNQIDTISTGTTFYSTLTGDTTPFSEKTFENSPLNRVLAQAAPGKSWATGSGHEIKFSYQANKSSDEVIIFEVKTTYNATAKIYDIELTRRLSPVYYADGTLYKTVTTDENGQPIVEFKNKEGQVILKRIDTSDGRHDTYYVYDIYGNLTYVLPPKLLDLYYGSNPLRADWQKLMDELGYQYVYDEKNRLVEKQLPGKGREFMVYDTQDRLTLQQDINQRTGTNKGWTFFKYDKFGRMVYSGFFKNSATRSSMQAALNNKQTPNNEERTSVGLGNNGTGLFYTNNQFPNGSLTVQSVHYYDHYQNLGVTPSSIIDGQDVIGVNDTRTKGLAVASYTNVLDETTWNKAYTFYDKEYLRPVASHLVNYLNGYQTTASVLDFRGKVKNTITKHKFSESEGNEITVKEEFDYYPNELLKFQTHQVNNNPKEYIVQNSYNEINQLTSKKVGNTNSSTPLQKVDYKYNIRGWLTDINNIDVTETGTYRDLFAYRINYDSPSYYPPEVSFGINYYNGNITNIKWKTTKDNIIRTYYYSYDNLNRLLSANYLKGNQSAINAFNESARYDKNGNILKMWRSGNQDLSNNVIWIDDLKYDYQANSNKLLNVSDDKTEDGFSDKNKYTGTTVNDARNDYKYDPNGNLIQDLNKGITKISYNYLNLPTEVLWGNGDKISYVYDANGTKLAKYVQKNLLSNAEATYYMNGFQYSQEAGKGNQSVLQFFPTTEGYVNVTDGTAFNYVYNYTDHLGNVRLSYQKESNGTLKVLEENNYYPFGLKHTGYNNTNVANAHYKYKYNGKELQHELNLNLYDYGARNYDPAIGRFFNIDPMSDERTWVSPFNYVQNNPISKVDPTGMLDGWIDYEENGQRNVEYRSDINTKAEAEAAGYKNVSKVIESGTLTASNGTVYNLSKTGGVSSDNVLGTINYNTTQDVITSGGSHIKGFLNGYDGPGAISSPSFSYFDRWDHQVAMGLWQGGADAAIGGAIGKGLSYAFGNSKMLATPTGQFYSVAFEMNLANGSYPGVSRYMHFKEANIALDAAMKTNPMLGELGISVPRSATGSIIGKSPSNWVWHHDINAGVMQLVPKSQHPNIPGGIFWNTMHPDGKGGFSIWGK